MKVYILCDNPYDEGNNIFGVFSKKEIAERAMEVFESKSNYELFIIEMELDALTRHFERALLPEIMYSGYRMSYAKWKFSPRGLDSFLEDSREESVSDWGNHMYASVNATSEQEALEKVEKMIEEGRVWKFDKENS